jgi:hypothetical protein
MSQNDKMPGQWPNSNLTIKFGNSVEVALSHSKQRGVSSKDGFLRTLLLGQTRCPTPALQSQLMKMMSYIMNYKGSRTLEVRGVW